jgi:hypothetical protein
MVCSPVHGVQRGCVCHSSCNMLTVLHCSALATIGVWLARFIAAVQKERLVATCTCVSATVPSCSRRANFPVRVVRRRNPHSQRVQHQRVGAAHDMAWHGMAAEDEVGASHAQPHPAAHNMVAINATHTQRRAPPARLNSASECSDNAAGQWWHTHARTRTHVGISACDDLRGRRHTAETHGQQTHTKSVRGRLLLPYKPAPSCRTHRRLKQQATTPTKSARVAAAARCVSAAAARPTKNAWME